MQVQALQLICFSLDRVSLIQQPAQSCTRQAHVLMDLPLASLPAAGICLVVSAVVGGTARRALVVAARFGLAAAYASLFLHTAGVCCMCDCCAGTRRAVAAVWRLAC